MANVSNKTFHVFHVHEAFSFPAIEKPMPSIYVLSVDRDIRIKEANDNNIDIC